jgi:peptidoglycan-N-acetylglucosamine deacetylase
MLIITAVAFAAMVLFVFWVEPLGVVGLLERLTPNIIYRVRIDRPLVALSFDDGPHPVFTLQVLDTLKKHNAKATFFLIGERALRHPELVARIKAQGHEVANHYARNGSTLFHSDADFLSHLLHTETAIGLLQGLKLFRPPGGIAWSRQLQLAKAHGYICVLGTAYPHDPLHPPVWYIQWLIKKNLVPGSIVILHDGISDPTCSLQALPHVLAEGQRRGVTFVSIGQLILDNRRQLEVP